MEIFISYFYHVRNMTANELPVSTAVFDPKWFHNFKDSSYKFRDKNGVLNGLRYSRLRPSSNLEGLCSGKPCLHSPESCQFLSGYYNQLKALDFDQVIRELSTKASLEGASSVVLLVHEKYDNLCSERIPLRRWFFENGMKLREWRL